MESRKVDKTRIEEAGRKKKKKERRKPMIEKVKMIERIMKEKENEEEDLIELRVTDEMVSR